MSEWVWAKIEIGGTVSRPQLTRLVDEFNVSPLPAGQNTPETVRFLGLEDSKARYGQFEALEAYLVEQAIPFDRASDGTFEHSPEVRRFRPNRADSGSDPLQHWVDRIAPCDYDDQPVVALADVTKAIAETKTQKELVARLTETCGPAVSELPPLNVTEAV